MRNLMLLAGAAFMAVASPALAKPDHAKGKGHGQNARHDGQQRYNGDDRNYANRNCPPGLAKKNNGCMAPGQYKKLARGQRYQSSYGDPYAYDRIPYDVRQRYDLDQGNRYYYDQGTLYGVDRRSGIIEQVLRLILR